MQMAVDRLIDARWTHEIHAEWIRNLARKVPAISVERLQVTRQLMDDAVPTANVTDYESHIPAVFLPDPADRHVVAAGIAADASVILTWNLRDFPAVELQKHGLRRLTPDAFLAKLYDEVPELTVASLANARRNLRKIPLSASDFIAVMKNQRLTQLATKIHDRLTDL